MTDIAIIATVMGTAVAVMVPIVSVVWYVINLRIKVVENDLKKLVEDRAKDIALLEKISDKLDKLTEKLSDNYVTTHQCETNMSNCKSKTKGEVK